MLRMRAGEWVTCENGHRICRAVVDQYSGDTIRLSNFDEWALPVPEMHDLMFCHCNARYGREGRLHVEGRGWDKLVATVDEDFTPFFRALESDRRGT